MNQVLRNLTERTQMETLDPAPQPMPVLSTNVSSYVPCTVRAFSKWIQDSARLTPTEKLTDSFGIRSAGIFVPDVCRKKFDEPPTGAIAGMKNLCRQFFKASALKVA